MTVSRSMRSRGREVTAWTKLGKRPGPVMYALGFMRVEAVYPSRGFRWRAWDVFRCPGIRPMHPTTLHKTLTAAKAHCEAIVDHQTRETPPPGR